MRFRRSSPPSGRAPKPLVNSGSSQPGCHIDAHPSEVAEQRRIKPGDEVITVVAGFHHRGSDRAGGAVPVFIDANPITGNACCDQLEAAYSPVNKGGDDGPCRGQSL